MTAIDFSMIAFRKADTGFTETVEAFTRLTGMVSRSYDRRRASDMKKASELDKTIADTDVD